MATIIEELLVTLNIDAEQFRLGSRQAQDDINRTRDTAHSAANDMVSSGNTGAQFFSKMRNEAMMLMGIFTAGMGLQSFVKNTVASITQTSILSDNIGLTTQKIKALEDATEAAGGSGQAMTNQLAKFAEMSARLKRGESSIDVLGTDFSTLGQGDWRKVKYGNPEEILKEYTKVYENLKTRAKAVLNISDKEAEAFASQQIQKMGISAEILPLLKKGELGINELVDKYKNLRGLTNENIENTKKAKLAWNDLTIQIESFSEKVLVTLTPAMEKLAVVMKNIKLPNGEEITKTLEEWTKNFTDFYNTVKAIFISLSDFWSEFVKKTKELTGGIVDLSDGLKVLTSLFAGLVAIKVALWVGSIATGLLSIASAAGIAATALAPLAAIAGAGAAGAYVGTKAYESMGESSQNMLGKGIATVASWLGNEEAESALETNKAFTPMGEIKLGGNQKQMMYRVYEAYRNAGFSEQQAKIMTSQVGRENDFSESLLFGTHIDPYNKSINLGMISMQKERGAALAQYLTERGLMKNGKIEHSQEALNAMAAFQLQEMQSGGYSVQEFLGNKDISYEQGERITGRNYIKWRYDDPAYALHHAKQRGYYEALNKISRSETSTLQLPTSTMLNAQSKTGAGVQNNNITINVKSTDPKQASHEIKTRLNEHLTTPFISNMAIQ